MARPFTEIELTSILGNLRRAGRERDALLLAMGSYFGFRVSELLSLRVSDVAEEGRARAELVVARRNLKGGKGVRCRTVCNRRVVVPESLRDALNEHIQRRSLLPGSYLFQSREGGNRPISRSQAHRIIVEAAAEAGVVGRIATHSMWKRFVQWVYALSGHNLIMTQRIRSFQCFGHPGLPLS